MYLPPGMLTRLAALPVIEGSPVNVQPVQMNDHLRAAAQRVAARRIADYLAVPPWIADPDRAGTENPEEQK